MKQRYSYLILLCVPLLYLAMSLCLMKARGPDWIMSPNDLSYHIILNSLSLINSEPLGGLFHPGATNVVFGVAVIETVHLIYGTTDIVTDVLHNPELYQTAYDRSLMVILTLSIFVSGIFVYSATKNLCFGVLFQASPLLLRFFWHTLAINGGMSENFQLAGGLLLAAIALKLVKCAPSSEPSTISNGWAYISMDIPWGRYAIWFAVIISFCIASKFTALPLLVFPLVLIPGIRRKLFFILAAIVSGLLFMLPIFQYWGSLFSFLIFKWTKDTAEHVQRGGIDSPIDRVLYGVKNLYSGSPGFCIILMLCICFCVLMLVLKRYTRIHFNPIASRLMFATTVCLVCATLFLTHRPHGHYLFPFVGLSGLGMILVFSITADMVRFSRWELEKGEWVVSRGLPVFVLVLFALIRFPDFQDNVKWWGNIKDDVMGLHRTLEVEYKDAAKINTPHTDTIWWALVISNVRAKGVYNKEIASVVPPDVYFYRWDGKNYYDAGGQHFDFDIEEIASKHNRVVFYGTPFLVTRTAITGDPNSYREPVDLTMHTVAWRGFKRIAQVDEIRLHGRFSFGPSGKTEQSRKSTIVWESSGGFPQWLQVDFFPNISRPTITRYTLDVKDKMPKSWQLQGSNDGINWSVLDERTDETNWVHKNVFYAVPQDLGSVDLYKPDVAAMPGVLTADTLEEVSKLINDKPLLLRSLPRVRYVDLGDREIRFYKPYNIFGFKDRFYLLPHNLRSVKDWDKVNVAALPGVYVADSIGDMSQIFAKLPLPQTYTIPPLNYVKEYGPYNIIKSNLINSFNVSNPGEYRYYRLYVTEGIDPTRLKVNGVNLYTKVEDLSGKSRVVLPNTVHEYEYGHPGEEALLEPFWEKTGSFFPLWLEMNIGENKTVALYSLQAGPQEHEALEKMPKDWHLQGSNDSTTWFTLDTRKNQMDWRYNEIREYTVQKPGQFRHYRLLITASNMPRTVRLYEWKLFAGLGAGETEKIFSPPTGFSQERREPYEMQCIFMPDLPRFVQSVGFCNIVEFNHLFYAVPNSLGPVDFYKEDVAAMEEVFTADRLEDALKYAGKRPASPRFVQSVGSCNIIEFDHLFYAVPNSLGPVDFYKEDVSAMPDVFAADRLEDALKYAGKRPASPRFVQSVGPCNIIEFNHLFYAIPHSLCSVDFYKEDVSAMSGVFAADRLEDALKYAEKRPASPRFVQSVGSCNIIEFNHLFYVIPHSLGPVDFYKEGVAAMEGVFAADRLEDVLKIVEEHPLQPAVAPLSNLSNP